MAPASERPPSAAPNPEDDPSALQFPESVYERIFRRARPFLQTRQNDLHTRLSYGFALRLLDAEGGRPQVVIPAVLLHDVGWSRVPEDRQLAAFGPEVRDPELRRVHEREGARMAREILTEQRYPSDLVDEIAEIVAGHDTRLVALGPDDAVVKDADKLFRFSRQGFRIDCARFGREPGEYLPWLEAQIDGWFLTATGSALARAEVAARRRELAGGGAGKR